jgi:hypothetical protein
MNLCTFSGISKDQMKGMGCLLVTHFSYWKGSLLSWSSIGEAHKLLQGLHILI